jgi:outer membrane protein W
MAISSARCLFAGVLALAATLAQAADLPSTKAPLEPPPVFETFQPFQVRLKAAAVIPDGRTTIYDTYGAVLPLAGLSFGAGSQVFGAGAKYSTSVIPAIDVAYFFTRNIAVETLCCATRNSVKGLGTIGGLPVGSTWALPVTALLQYHFTNFGAFQPYIGVGAHYTFFPWSKGGQNWQPFFAPAFGAFFGSYQAQTLKIANAAGVVGQVGFDYMFTENWGVNLDLKRYLLEPTGYVNVGQSLTGTIPVRARVNIDPWVVSGGITYRFGGSIVPVVARY